MIINSNPGKYLAGWASRRAEAAYRETQEKKTMTTEELKREMYRYLVDIKKLADSQASFTTAEALENSLGAYLEELRKDLNFACASVDLADAKARKAAEERDAAIRKLQAFEFANKSAGELLIRAQETIKRQRKFIRTLYTSRKARKVAGATRIQSSPGNVSEVKCGTTALRDPLMPKKKCTHPKGWRTISLFTQHPMCAKCGTYEEDF